MHKVLKVLLQGLCADPFHGVPPRQNRGRGGQTSILCARQLLSKLCTTATGGLETIHHFVLSSVAVSAYGRSENNLKDVKGEACACIGLIQI